MTNKIQPIQKNEFFKSLKIIVNFLCDSPYYPRMNKLFLCQLNPKILLFLFYINVQYVFNASTSFDPDGYKWMEYYYLCRDLNDGEFNLTYHNITNLKTILPSGGVVSPGNVI